MNYLNEDSTADDQTVQTTAVNPGTKVVLRMDVVSEAIANPKENPIPIGTVKGSKQIL